MNNFVKSSKPILAVEDLSIDLASRGGRAKSILKNVSFKIFPGEIVGLIGESGSGKSMTSKAVLGMMPERMQVKSGLISFEGKDLLLFTKKEMREIRGSRLSLIPQDALHALNPVVKVGVQTSEPFSIHKKMSKKKRLESAIELFGRVKIPEANLKVNDFPHQFSGGMQQRALTAMSISMKPILVIADEPTTALDVTIQAQIIKMLKELSTDLKISFLFISHDLGLISSICSRVYVMNHGEIVEQGNTREVFLDPKHPYTKGLIGCRPKLMGNPRRLKTIDANLSDNEFVSKTNHKVKKQNQTASIKSVSGVADKKLNEPNVTKILKEPIFDVKGLSKVFFTGNSVFQAQQSKIALSNISFSIRPGESLWIVGESGSGKTTILRILLKLIPYTEGQVTFGEKELSEFSGNDLKNFRQLVQPVFQDPYSTFNPRFSIFSSLSLALEVQNLSEKGSRKQQILDILEQVGLSYELSQSYPHQLSGGQRQRAAIARALLCNPKVLLLDEPTSALDVSVQAQVLNLIKDLQDIYDFAIIMVTHDLPVVSFICEKLIVMQNGKIIESGDTKQIIGDSKAEYTKDLIAAVPLGL